MPGGSLWLGPARAGRASQGRGRALAPARGAACGAALMAALLVLFDRIPVRYRAMLLLATFASLRFGELAALRRSDVDLERATVRVVRSLVQKDSGPLVEDTPESRAGRRPVAFPREIVPELSWHLERFAEPGQDGLLFVGPKGGRLRRSNFHVLWVDARDAAGLPDLHHARLASHGEHACAS
jgi:integrase